MARRKLMTATERRRQRNAFAQLCISALDSEGHDTWAKLVQVTGITRGTLENLWYDTYKRGPYFDTMQRLGDAAGMSLNMQTMELRVHRPARSA